MKLQSHGYMKQLMRRERDCSQVFSSHLNASLSRMIVFWVTVNEVPNQEGKLYFAMWKDVVATKNIPGMARIRLREPEKLITGGIHVCLVVLLSVFKERME